MANFFTIKNLVLARNVYLLRKVLVSRPHLVSEDSFQAVPRDGAGRGLHRASGLLYRFTCRCGRSCVQGSTDRR